MHDERVMSLRHASMITCIACLHATERGRDAWGSPFAEETTNDASVAKSASRKITPLIQVRNINYTTSMTVSRGRATAAAGSEFRS